MSAPNERDRDTIRVILREMGVATYPDLVARGGRPLAGPLMELVGEGEVIREDGEVRRYRLKA